MEIEITSLSKKKEKLSESAAAAYVITAEEIRRSGHTSIPDLLRMVPGLQVARINSNTWAVTSRGMAHAEYANKMLVMIDGRSIYTPLHGGVYWNTHDVPLESIERIEVIRGPGGALWGANAVNGVINIITKSARDTQGGLVTAGAGTDLKSQGMLRYGGKIDDGTYYRVYGKYLDRDEGRRIDGLGAGRDGWDTFQSGFRLDSEATDRDHLTVQGDFLTGDIGRISTVHSLTAPYAVEVTEDLDVDGQNLLARWTRQYADDSDLSLQMYYDRTRRREIVFNETRQTYDLDFQHRFWWRQGHEITWGLGYRLTSDRLSGTFDFDLDPDAYDLDVFSGFVQDRIALLGDRVNLILGSKFEHNDFTGFEYQPSARLVWNADAHRTLWASVARGVRTPTRYDRDVDSSWGVTPGPPVYAVRAYGNDDQDAEKVLAYELGYRCQPSERLSLDLAAFFNRYDDLRTFEGSFSDAINMGSYILMPFTAGNKMDGETYGIELAAVYEATDDWTLNLGYAFLQMQLHPDNSSTYTRDEGIEGASPHNQLSLRSYWNVTDALEFDLAAYYVDNLPSQDTAHTLRLDARLGWRINENTELSLVGQNLLQPRHKEFDGSNAALFATEAERAFFVQLRHSF